MRPVLVFWLEFRYLVTGATDDGREDGAGSVISGETGFAHSRSIVNDQCGNFVVTHVVNRGWLVRDEGENGNKFN